MTSATYPARRDEQADLILARCGVSCPGWCREHELGPGRAGVVVVSHLWDLVDHGPYVAWLGQSDWISQDGDLVRRDPAMVALAIDDGEPDIRDVVALHGPERNHADGWEVDGRQAVTLAEELRNLPYAWAPGMAGALRTLADAAGQPRRGWETCLQRVEPGSGRPPTAGRADAGSTSHEKGVDQ